jgi:hypothetical protein
MTDLIAGPVMNSTLADVVGKGSLERLSPRLGMSMKTGWRSFVWSAGVRVRSSLMGSNN